MVQLLNSLGRFPWGIVIVVAMWVSYQMSIDLSGTLGLAFIALCVFVVIVEFFKSGDIRLGPFLTDLVGAAIGLIAGTALVTHMLIQGQVPGFHYWLGALILVVDAILSPFNSFRTALRNFQVGGNG